MDFLFDLVQGKCQGISNKDYAMFLKQNIFFVWLYIDSLLHYRV